MILASVVSGDRLSSVLTLAGHANDANPSAATLTIFFKTFAHFLGLKDSKVNRNDIVATDTLIGEQADKNRKDQRKNT